ncbi:MAG: diguanylate cyclase [Clostridiales bacterium]|nr:diguanylate cyclase [Clostridiales bacterium]MCF8021160.1 diguanylate cyclase [Clostridiales bacterium]
MNKSTIVIIGNKVADNNSLHETLNKTGYRVMISSNINCIKELLFYNMLDLLVLDDAFDELELILQVLREHKSSDIPVIFMGSANNLAQDENINIVDEILDKPVNYLEILSRTKSILEIRHMQLQLKDYDNTQENKTEEHSETMDSNIIFQTPKPRVLIIEDSKLQNLIIRKNLGEETMEFIPIYSGSEALNLASTNNFDLIILDIVLPDINGFKVCKQLKSDTGTANIPVLMITSLESMSDKLKGLEHGADDYLIKPINKKELNLRVNSLLRKKQLHDKMVHNYNKAYEESIRDRLTGLYNHGYFIERLKSEVDNATRYNKQFSLLFLDIDNFKPYNDSNGHPAGDNVLRELAGILVSTTRESDIVSRYGGEEFTVLLPETNKDGAIHAAHKIQRNVEYHPFPFQEYQPSGNLTVSLGVATFPEDAGSAKELLNNSDQALYKAKKNSKNKYIVYEPNLH